MSQIRPIIVLENVDVDIDGHRVLNDIRFEISSGQHWGIVGGNGSGKSTLLALLSGRRWPTPGGGSRIYDFGSGPEYDAVTARERVALLGHELQDLYVARGWNFRARNIVQSGLTRTDIPRRKVSSRLQDEAEALLKHMDLGHLADRRLLELSRGEQRRVLIARSLAFDPALLLLDEPSSGLDSRSRTGLEATLMRAAEKVPIVIATHRADELPSIVTRIATLTAGRLKSDDTMIDRSLDGAAGPTVNAHQYQNPLKRQTTAPERVMIALEAASVRLGGRQILRKLDWELRPGDHWLVTGENGAGKSTMLRLLHAEIRPATGGKIRWPGFDDPQNVWSLRRQIALVSPELQARYRFPTRVFDAIASGFHSSIGLTRQLSSAQRDRVRALLTAFELEPFSDRLLSTLSYGQRYRSLIARTLATNPKVLLLDEPWDGLDAKSSEIVRTEIARCMAADTQVICSSHVGTGGLKLNRILTLRDGSIVNGGDSA